MEKKKYGRPAAEVVNVGRDIGKSTGNVETGYGRFYRKTKFRPKKPIRGFRDLEIYQRAQELVLLVRTKVVPLVRDNDDFGVAEIRKIVSGISEKIAEAHSRRFEDKKKAIELLNDAKADCNRMAVFLDQVASMPMAEIEKDGKTHASKDNGNVGSGTEGMKELCWDLIKRFGTLRMKIYNLQKAWQGFWLENKGKK